MRSPLKPLMCSLWVMVLLLVSLAQATEPLPYRIAVLPYQLAGAAAADEGRSGWGVELAGEIEAALGLSGRFVTIDRRRFDDVIGEQVLGVRGLSDEEFRALGSLLGATMFVEGTIAVNPGRPLRVTTRIIRVASGHVMSLPQDVAGPESFPDLARRVAEWALERFPPEGRVVAIEPEGAFVNLGTAQGLTARDAGGEILRERQIAGLDATEPIGSFRVVRILPGVTLIEPSMEDGFTLRLGDVVRFVLTAVAAEPEPEAPASGSLLVRGAPVGATVFVDGEDVGVIGESGLLRSLPVGSVWVEVRADGYEPFARRVEVVADDVAEVVVGLVRAPPTTGALALSVQPEHASVFVDGALVGRGSVVLEDLSAGAYRYRVEASGFEPVVGEALVVAGQREQVRVALAAVARVVGTGSLPAEPTYVRMADPRLEVGADGGWLVSFDVAWDESWRGPDRPSWVAASDNWDAVWVFVKYRVDGGEWRHVTLAGAGHVVPAGAVVDVPSDRVGAFIYRSRPGYGTFSANGVGLVWDHRADGVPDGARVEVRPFAIEMVYVPEGPFSVGSGGSSPHEFRAGGTSSTPFVVSRQSSIALGNGAGQLMWTDGGGSGSPSGSTSASFPTGYDGFYLMKHQLTQGEYANFLNTLTQPQADARKHKVSTHQHRYAFLGSRVGSYETWLPFVAMHFVSWADGAAFADWAGLRPMTELEFEKAARGPLAPVREEFAWGSTSIEPATGRADPGTGSEAPTPAGANAAFGGASGVQGPVRVGSFAAPGRSRRDAGAGYFGALELSGNLWERAVTVGNAEGRAFAGTHGDGVLDAGGNSSVVSWPGTDSGGAGLRGGTWNTVDGNLRVSTRSHAATAVARRGSSFGWRGVRSAP